jgi:hypothetical protein
MIKIKTKKANRFEAGRQLDELVVKLGIEAVSKRIIVYTATISSWRSDFIPVTRCVAVGELHREVFQASMAS